MSIDATLATWKLSKKQVTPIQKLILLSYADRVGESFECWPSNSRLELDTGLDRHTICENKQKLIEKGLIVYTGEKRGRTKSIDVIRLTYVKGREHSHPDANKQSSVKKPTAQKSSSVKMPIPKQCGNAHTESLSIEPLITTTTSSGSFTTFEKQCLELRSPTDTRDAQEFIENVNHHIEHNSPKENPYPKRRRMILSLLRKVKDSAEIFQSVGYVSESDKRAKEKKQKDEKEKLAYDSYVSVFKNDRDFLKLASVQGKEPLTFKEWHLLHGKECV